MEKFIIIWNTGYGDNAEVFEAETLEEAQAAAYEAWREDAECQAEYQAHPYTADLASDHDLDEEES